MSGPKLVGIVCDEASVQRSLELLRRIGKYEYFKDIYTGINTDINNSADWFRNYGKGLLNNSNASVFAQTNMISIIDQVKQQYIDELLSYSLDISIIEDKTEDELQDIGIKTVKSIPELKQKFIDEISKMIDEFEASYEDLGISHDELLRKKLEENDSTNINRTQNSSFVDFEAVDMVSLANISGSKKEKREERFSLSEMIFIESVIDDIKSVRNDEEVYMESYVPVANICSCLQIIQDENKIYSFEAKRDALFNLKVQYNSLEKNIIEKKNERETNRFIREKNISECTVLLDALGMDMQIENMSNEELEELLDRLEVMALRQEERIYVEDAITEIMMEYGYADISSTNLHDADQVSTIVYEGKEDEKLRVSFGDGMIMIQVVGEGSLEPTEEEVAKQLVQQGALCEIYPEIKKKLKDRKIGISMENCAEVSRDSCKNIVIDRQQGSKKSKKHRIPKRTMSSESFGGQQGVKQTNSLKAKEIG